MDIFKKLSWFFKQEKRAYIIGILSLFLVAVLNVFPSRIVGIVVDEINQNNLTQTTLIGWVALLIVLALAMYALRYVWRVRIWGNAAKMQRIIRQNLYNHITVMDSEFFDKYRTGDLMAHATNDLNNLRMVAGAGILMIADIISVGLTTIIAMIVVVDWRLTLTTIIPLALLIIVSRFLGRELHKKNTISQEAFSNINNKVQESIQGIKVIKAFGQEREDTSEFKALTQDTVEKNEDLYRIDSVINPAVTIISGLSYVIAIMIGGFFVIEDYISIGDFITFINYIGMLIWPMMAIGQLFNIVERGNASYDRIEKIMQEESSIIEKEDAVTESAQGDIQFSIDSFTYPGSQTPALQDIHVHLKKGETLGIVGKTGSGKTTLFKLLLRSYDNYKGKITFGGIDIRDYTLTALLSQIGYVPQENFLFSNTIRENIRFANPAYSQKEVEYAAELANIHDDIEEFPNGYDTTVGERGVSLSGGQKQRVAIARALIKNPELLILDDSLSAVDAKTEERILSNLKTERNDQTTIITAHRISSVMHAEEIIVLEDGRISERGTHEDLIRNGQWYSRMFEQQQLQEETMEGVE